MLEYYLGCDSLKKFIIPLLCYSIILVILLNLESITNFLVKTVSNNQILTIDDGNEYSKNYDFSYVKNSKTYIPYSYNDLIDILYSILNQGWSEFTFYCQVNIRNVYLILQKLPKMN